MTPVSFVGLPSWACSAGTALSTFVPNTTTPARRSMPSPVSRTLEATGCVADGMGDGLGEGGRGLGEGDGDGDAEGDGSGEGGGVGAELPLQALSAATSNTPGSTRHRMSR